MKENCNKLGEKIKIARLEKGMSIADLAKELDVARVYVNDIELGNRGFNEMLMKKISSVLDIPYEELKLLLEQSGLKAETKSIPIEKRLTVCFAPSLSEKEKEKSMQDFYNRLREVNK